MPDTCTCTSQAAIHDAATMPKPYSARAMILTKAAAIWPVHLVADAYLKGASASMVTTHGEMLDAYSTKCFRTGKTFPVG